MLSNANKSSFLFFHFFFSAILLNCTIPNFYVIKNVTLTALSIFNGAEWMIWNTFSISTKEIWLPNDRFVKTSCRNIRTVKLCLLFQKIKMLSYKYYVSNFVSSKTI